MPNGHIASKLQEVNLYKQNAMLARATYVNSRNNTRAIIYACIAVLSWSTVATAFKIALTHLTHFEMLLIASCTSRRSGNYCLHCLPGNGDILHY